MVTEKLVSIKAVKQAIVKLQSQGDRLSNRNIRRVLGGGSPNDIQSILQQIEDAEGAGVNLPIEIPENIQSAILSGINTLVTEVTSGLQKQVQRIKAEHTEALDELEQALLSNANLRTEFDKLLDYNKLGETMTKADLIENVYLKT